MTASPERTDDYDIFELYFFNEFIIETKRYYRYNSIKYMNQSINVFDYVKKCHFIFHGEVGTWYFYKKYINQFHDTMINALFDQQMLCLKLNQMYDIRFFLWNRWKIVKYIVDGFKLLCFMECFYHKIFEKILNEFLLNIRLIFGKYKKNKNKYHIFCDLYQIYYLIL